MALAPMKVGAKGMKAATKAMKVMKSMKTMKVSKVAAGKLRKALVFRGSKEKTRGGLTKEKLMKNSVGKVVSKAMSAVAKQRYASSGFKKYHDALKRARKELKITGFCAVNGATAQGKALYAKVKSILGK